MSLERKETHMTTLASILPLADDHWDGPGPWVVVFPLFWALVIFGIAWTFRGRGGWRRGWSAAPRPETGAEILDRRFAQGEIDAEEYRDRRAELDAQR
jgi:putative membrane protein